MNGLKYPRDWEPVNAYTERMLVPGGWLVHTFLKTVSGDKFFTNSEALVYVPDKENRWILEKS